MANNPTVPSSTNNGTNNVASTNSSLGTTSAVTITESQRGVLEYLYNSLPYRVEIYLQNTGEINAPEEERYQINPASIINLSICENLNEWVVDGSITLLFVPQGSTNKNKGGQNQATKTTGATSNRDVNSYSFRADGFDYLRVCIKPINKSKNKNSNNNQKNQSISDLDTEGPKWILSYLFSITNIEDINDVPELRGPMGPYMKCLKLSFHDFRYQIMRTTNLEYSTALSVGANRSNNLYNKGSLLTGKAMMEIFNKALSNPLNGGARNLTVNAQKWDQGIAEIFYTSPSQYTANDDIQYLLSNHISSVALGPSQGTIGPPNPNQARDLSVLHTERPNSLSELESICFSPLTNFFNQAGKEQTSPGPLQYEHFFVTGDTDVSSSPTTTLKAPIGLDNNAGEIKTSKYGQIISYSFVDICPIVNAEQFITTPVHSVDLRERKFKIDYKANDVVAARGVLSNSYIKQNLYLEQDGGTGNFLLQLHESKKNVNVFPTFSLNADNPIIRQKNGLHKLINNGIFQNQCICFSVLGLTLRESGTFIAIDKSSGASPNDYNNKLYGQWFVIRVDHIFEGGKYFNTIYAVKMHRSAPLKIPFKHVI